MMRNTLRMWATISTLAIVGMVRADWKVGDPFKWVQLPDLSPNGMDILDTAQPTGSGKILADDWLCTSTDPVADVHIWGSWLNDLLPMGQTGMADPANVKFKLSIHADVPAVVSPEGLVLRPSHPGALLWKTITYPTSVRNYATGDEAFYNPNTQQYMGRDTIVWQYNFTNLYDADFGTFMQKGTATNPVIYWLDVQAMPGDSVALFGWKTSIPPHRLDDAVFGDTDGFGGPLILNLPGSIEGSGWTEMYYPGQSIYSPQSLDLAFVITPEPGTLAALAIGGMLLLSRRRRA
jgi:hypothetical protein